MTDAYLCNRCGDVERHGHRTGEYDLPGAAWDSSNYETGAGVRGNGHLCENCSVEFAHWLKEGPSDD